MMSIIVGILIVYIIDKKLSNVIVKIPRLEPIVIKTEENDAKKIEIHVREKNDDEQPVLYRERLKPSNSMDTSNYHQI
jgi:hypothetical protein